jgi:hypothetical protein
MAEESAKKEDSVLFSLKELKRIGAEAGAKPAEKPAERAAEPKLRTDGPRVSHKASDPDEKESETLVGQALTSLRERVDEEKRRIEEAKKQAEEQRRLTDQLRRMEEDMKRAEAARARAEHDRKEVSGRVSDLQGEAAKYAPAPVYEEPPPPRGVFLKPATLAIAITIAVVAVGGMAAFAFLKKPKIQYVNQFTPTKAAAETPGIPASALDFGTEIGWLDQGDVAAPPPAMEEERPKRKRGRRRRGRTQETAAAPVEKKPKLQLPQRPTGFVY